MHNLARIIPDDVKGVKEANKKKVGDKMIIKPASCFFLMVTLNCARLMFGVCLTPCTALWQASCLSRRACCGMKDA
eukprot:1148472-Pelagomonas_calceolata.AAC.5